MASANLLALIDDIASLLDDIAVLSKVAAKKTAGVLGDDLALNAQQVTGVRAERELPVVWAVAKGSFLNKCILVPLALLISALIPWLIQPMLMLGGAFLCFEGAEKVIHNLFHKSPVKHKDTLTALADPEIDMATFEKDKIKGAIRTDFILSAEIIVITLGTVAAAQLTQQIMVVSTIAFAMTAGVYGLVALIVKLDDIGLYLTLKSSGLARAIGRGLLWFAPNMMKTLSIVGTAAMFLVGGSILIHGLPLLHHASIALTEWLSTLPTVLSLLGSLTFDLIVGLLLGSIIVAIITAAQKWLKPSTPA